MPSPSLLEQDAKLVQIVDAALADAARRSGSHLSCRPGCTQCCHGAFAISPLDAQRLRAGMAALAKANPAQAAVLESRAQAYLAEYGPTFPGNRTTGILDEDPEAQDAFDGFANEAPCPALSPESGLCELYEFRPMTCRVFGPPVRIEMKDEESASPQNDPPAFSVCELCFTQATAEEIAAAEMHLPHQEEQQLLDSLRKTLSPEATGDTIIAYCLIPQPDPPPAPPQPS